MLDTDEANLLSIAAASLHGQPLYHPILSTDVSYSLMYGPVTFFVYRLALLSGNGSFLVLRILVVTLNLLLCAVLYSTFRKLLRRDTAIALIAFALCPLLQWVKCSFGVRPDIGIILAMSLAVRATLMDAELPAAILTGLCAGIAIDFKLTVLPAFAFLLLILFRRFGTRAAAIAAIIATATALAPFALPAISLHNYLDLLALTRTEGVGHAALIYSLFFAIFLAAPLAILIAAGTPPWPAARQAWPELSLLTLCLVAATLISAKPGAGPWHFWQLIPVIAGYLALTLSRSEPSPSPRLDLAICLIAVSSAAFGLSFAARNLATLRAPQDPTAQQLRLGRIEIAAALDRYRGHTLQMGYGPSPNEPVELLRYLLPLHGQPYTLDGSGRLEAGLVPFPSRITQKMNTCTDDLWLIPHDEQPFDHWRFPAALRRAFTQHYAIAQRGAIYDVWACRSTH